MSQSTKSFPHNITKRVSPPRASLAFRVGVVGHRPNRLIHADLGQLAKVVKAVLSNVKDVFGDIQKIEDLFDGTKPVLRAISPLAEGSDRLFAEQALDLGYELCCVMPFTQADFERDFAPEVAQENDSLSRFRALADKASARFELDGCRVDEPSAYGAAGRTVLNQSDLLIVVWDGRREGKHGGTEETFDEARRNGVPVVWIDAHAPHSWQLLDATMTLTPSSAEKRLSPTRSDDVDSLRNCVRAALELPNPKPKKSLHSETNKQEETEDPTKGLILFYSESQPRWTFAVVWKAFRDIVADCRFPRVRVSVSPFEEAVKDEWPEDCTSALRRVVDRLRPIYAWPDKLAVLYADRYRSAFILAFLLAALAVGMALIPVGLQMAPHQRAETICIVIELITILIILLLVFRGRRAHWHERWINYRLTAELIRHLRLVAPLGGARPFPQIPAHWATYGQPGSTWMAWYVRAIERAIGLPTAVVNKVYLDECLWHLTTLLDGQISFHKSAVKRCGLMEHRLHSIGIVLLILTLGSCALHLLPSIWPTEQFPSWIPPILTFACGFFPALGATLAGIINQGEFRRVEKRSESMLEQLEILKKQNINLRQVIETATEPYVQQFSQQAVALSNDTARLLVNEVLDWRVVFLDRPLVAPS